MEGSSKSRQQYVGKRTTILSIDGGGVRGIIPIRILQFLEAQLQILDGPSARLADYFDVAAGTSTGGLIAGLLSVPNEQGRPRYTANDAMQFLSENAKNVFMKSSDVPYVSQLLGPKYSAHGFEKVLQDKFEDLKMQDTLLELIIPTFDIKLMEPTYFSTSEAKKDASKNVYIRDALRGSAAAPTYFPPALFYTVDSNERSREYNLVDGGIALNNPAHHAILNVQKECYKKSGQYANQVDNQHYHRFLLISLGTGKVPNSYDSKHAAHWGILSWIENDGRTPILDMLFEGIDGVVDFNLSVLFQTFQCPENYIRIQALDIKGPLTFIDNVTNENLQNLMTIGDQLLDSIVTTIDLDTGKYIPQPQRGTNKEALTRFAQELVAEHRARCTF